MSNIENDELHLASTTNGKVAAGPNPDIVNSLRLVQDRSPSVRSASSRWVGWGNVAKVLGQPFDSTRIPLSKLMQMRRDPMIAFALSYCKVPLVRAPFLIECARPDVAAAVDELLRKIYGRYILAHCNDFDFGYSPMVKRFAYGHIDATYVKLSGQSKKEVPAWPDSEVQPVVWRNFVPLHPQRVTPRWSPSGSFAGIDIMPAVGETGFSSLGRTNNDKPPDIPIGFALWTTNERDAEFNSIWGYPRIGYAYRYWWSYWYRFALADRAFERFADPAIQVYHPTDVIDDVTGQETAYQAKALQIGEDIRSGATVAMPNTVKEAMDGSAIASMREWEVHQVEGKSDFSALNQAFEYLDTQKVRSVLVPEQALMEGRGGTSSRNVAATFGETFFQSLAVKKEEIDFHLNTYVIPQLVQQNWGPGIPCRISSKGFDSRDFDAMKQIVQLIGQSDPSGLPVDIREVLDQLGIPLKSIDEINAEMQQASKVAAETLPPQTNNEGQPGMNGANTPPPASVNAEGKYEETPWREVIHLAEDRWPPTAQFADPQIRELATELKVLWATAYADSYESFARYLDGLSADELGLAEDDSVLKRILDGWSGPELPMDRTRAIIRRVADLASARGLRQFGLSAGSEWTIDRPDVQAWMKKRGSMLVRSVTQTVKKELRTFLADKMKDVKSPSDIAADVRQHFAQWPGWKAERLARTEVRDAYNQATLLGYREAGVAQVQAFDGAGGITGRTDPECVARNGKVFSIDDALLVDEHPNGTLGWRPIMAANFSVEVVPQTDLPLEGGVAWYDSSSETLFLAEGLGPDEVRDQMLLVGDVLSRTGEAGKETQ